MHSFGSSTKFELRTTTPRQGFITPSPVTSNAGHLHPSPGNPSFGSSSWTLNTRCAAVLVGIHRVAVNLTISLVVVRHRRRCLSLPARSPNLLPPARRCRRNPCPSVGSAPKWLQVIWQAVVHVGGSDRGPPGLRVDRGHLAPVTMYRINDKRICAVPASQCR
jgi:hypothetical protein